jgi:hypothetical protein
MVRRKAIHFSEPATTRLLLFWDSIQSPDLAGKRIELLREAIPALKRFAILAWLDYAGTVLDVGAVHAAGKGVGLEVVIFPRVRVISTLSCKLCISCKLDYEHDSHSS